jgi:hypothetical protein
MKLPIKTITVPSLVRLQTSSVKGKCEPEEVQERNLYLLFGLVKIKEG